MADGMAGRGAAGDEALDEGAAAAERAFEALRAEVGKLRGAVAALVEQTQRSGQARAAEVAAVVEASAAAPDYSPTLGVIAKELKGIGARLTAIEAHPALMLTPAQHVQQVVEGTTWARDEAVKGVEWASARLRDAMGELWQVVGSAHGQLRQRRREWTAVGIGAVLGFVVWWPLAWGLPWGLGDRLASTLVAGAGRWGAGQTLMREANPEAWERLVRLYNACPQASSMEQCEAALAVRTVPPEAPAQSSQSAQPGPEGVRAGGVGTVPAPPRSRGSGSSGTETAFQPSSSVFWGLRRGLSSPRAIWSGRMKA